MTLSSLYDFLYSWIDIVINGKRTLSSYSIQSIGSCVFTYNSKIVTGTNFITNGIVQVDGYIRIGTNYWAQIDTIDSETQITLKKNYIGVTATGTSYYSDVGIDIVIGSQNFPKPEVTYIIIHEPPMSNRKVGNTQRNSVYVEYEDEQDLVGDSYTDYSNTWRCVINIEEVNSTGGYLQKVMNTIEEDNIKDLWEVQKNISLEDIFEGSANNDILGNIIEKRYNMEVSLLYTEETTIESEIIEEVEISERTYNI